MIRRGVKLQLVAFAAITLLTVSVLSARFIGLTDRIIGGTYVVLADFKESGGIFVGSEVTYRGVQVGRVESLRLSKDGVLVQARLERGIQVPKDTRAVVENRSAVGEQYLDLQPNTASGPFLAEGDTIPRAATASPIRVDQLLQHTDDTVRSVDRRNLTVTVNEMGNAFADGGTDLQRLLDSGDALTRAATAALPETVKLIDDGRIVLDTQRATSDQIKVTAKNFADLAETLRDRDSDLRVILDRGVVASQQLDALIKENQGALTQLFANFITIGNVTSSRVGGLEQLLVTYPDVVAGGFTVVPGDGTAHFGLIDGSTPPACTRGYEGTQKIDASQTSGLPPLNTAAGCRLPRGSASAVRGAQNAPRPSSAAASSYPMAYANQPVPLGNPAVTQANPLGSRVQTPLAPNGASGVDTWLWMMKAAAE